MHAVLLPRVQISYATDPRYVFTDARQHVSDQIEHYIRLDDARRADLPVDPPPDRQAVADALRQVASLRALPSRAGVEAEHARLLMADLGGYTLEQRDFPTWTVTLDAMRALDRIVAGNGTAADFDTLGTAAELLNPPPPLPAAPPVDRASAEKPGPVDRALGILVENRGQISISKTAKLAKCARSTLHNSDRFMQAYNRSGMTIPRGHKTSDGDVDAYDD